MIKMKLGRKVRARPADHAIDVIVLAASELQLQESPSCVVRLREHRS